MEDCIFCKIISGAIPSKLVYEDDQAVVFDDLHPKAPVHMLVVPKRHIPRLMDAAPADEGLLGHLLEVANRVARQRGVAEDGYRVVINVNRGAGQVVFHLHLHVMGGHQFA
jgi:histidine triad (HIT) family protein